MARFATSPSSDGRPHERDERRDEDDDCERKGERKGERHPDDPKRDSDADRIRRRDGGGSAHISAKHVDGGRSDSSDAIVIAAGDGAEEELPDPWPVLHEEEHDDLQELHVGSAAVVVGDLEHAVVRPRDEILPIPIQIRHAAAGAELVQAVRLLTCERDDAHARKRGKGVQVGGAGEAKPDHSDPQFTP